MAQNLQLDSLRVEVLRSLSNATFKSRFMQGLATQAVQDDLHKLEPATLVPLLLATANSITTVPRQPEDIFSVFD
jgi:hypothetical protein